MKRFVYDQLRYARIKSTVSGLLLVSMLSVCVIVFLSRSSLTKASDIPHLIAGISAVTLLGLSLVLPLERRLDAHHNFQFTTYQQIGWFKFNQKVFAWPEAGMIVMEQDARRYYCLIIRLPGNPLVLERHPTLKQANERLIKLKKVFLQDYPRAFPNPKI